MVINIEERATISFIEEDAAIYEEIDHTITNCMLKAEKKCRKVYMVCVPFLPQLVMYLNLFNVWCLITHKKKGSCSDLRTIICLQTRTTINGKLLELRLIETYQKYKESIYTYCKFRKNH